MNVLLGSKRNKSGISRRVGASIGRERQGVNHILRPEPLMWEGQYRWKKMGSVNSPPVSVLTRFDTGEAFNKLTKLPSLICADLLWRISTSPDP
jgi:hypothetical protein